MLTSIATASESRADINAPYTDETGRTSTSALESTALGAAAMSPYTPTSPNGNAPYSPGLRSQSAQRTTQGDGFETQSPGEIPMQSFQDGLPPPPPVSHSWKRIDNWADENYPELFDQLCEGATNNDLNELEHQLDCTLPQDVRESLMIHDGQERGGNPTGIIFGSMLMDCEEIVQEWETWRTVNQEFLLETSVAKPSVPSRALGGDGQASSSKGPASPAAPDNRMWRQDLISRQESVPPGAVRKAYAHAGWIPLVRDWGGNNLAVDLAPGPAGQWGQVILFGRDYDTKYVIARSWAAFLAVVADDLNSGKWFVDEDTNELKLREFKDARVEPAYFNILRWRMDQKYGRRAAKRKSVVPNRGGSPAGSGANSPYASSVDGNGEARGRSMQRFGGASPVASPIRPAYGKSSPLAKVAEESTLPPLATNGLKPQKLVELDSPRPSEDIKNPRLAALTRGDSLAEDKDKDKENVNISAKVNGKQPEVSDETTMKTIEI
jgi:cell wall assembly regulator SMI1